MSTRGMAGIAFGGKIKASFNRFDSYPSALGVEVLLQAKELGLDIAEACAQFERMQAVDISEDPSMEQERALLVDHPPAPREPNDWDIDSKLTAAERYAKVRDAESRWSVLLDFPQNVNLVRMLASGYYHEDGTKFCRDNLFCEWAFVIDLDRKELQAYCGKYYAEERSIAPGGTIDDLPCALDAVEVGKWGWRAEPEVGNQMAMVARWPLAELPTEDQMLRQVGSEWEIEQLDKQASDSA